MSRKTWVPVKEFASTIGRSLPTAKRIATSAGIRRLPGTLRWTLHPDDVDRFLSGETLATKPNHNTVGNGGGK